MKKHSLLLLLFVVLFYACEDLKENSSLNPVNWEKRTVSQGLSDSLIVGKTYLSVYSEIYNFTEHKTHRLTTTVSMRNMNDRDSIYILNAKYFNTAGEAVRTYFDKPIFLAPMETVEIVVNEIDKTGGTGANFTFDWKVKPGSEKPFFEAVMISNAGGLGVSFTTEGKEYQHLN